MRRTLLTLIFFLLLIGNAVGASGDTEIWFGPLQHETSVKYDELLNNPSQWTNARNNVDVLLITQDISNLHSDAYSKLSGIKLALEVFITESTRSPDKTISCNSDIQADHVIALIRTIRSKGGDVKYVNMVEPLFEMQKSPKIADYIITLGMSGDKPIAGDWDNDGIDTIGVFRPTQGKFYLRNTNSQGNADITATFGTNGDLPIAGDWNNDGIDTIGVYRPSEKRFFLSNSNTQIGNAPSFVYSIAMTGDIPIAGDWNNDGIDTIGVFRPGTSTFFLRNTNSQGNADITATFGTNGDMPIIGDWNNDGIDTIGVYRPSTSTFFLSNSNTAPNVNVIVTFGKTVDKPIAGDWDGNRINTIGVYRPGTSTFFLSNSNSMPLENACKYTTQQVVNEVKKFSNKIKAYDSNLIVGEIEAVPVMDLNSINNYLDLAEASGLQLPYLYLDFNGLKADSDHIDKGAFLKGAKQAIEEHNMEIGIVMHSDWTKTTDRDFYDNTMSWIQTVNENIGVPQKVSFESWGDSLTLLPSTLVPETQQYSFTKMINDGLDIMAPYICNNECTTSGSKQCSGNGYQTCGEYDTDTCLEWSTVTSCPSGQACSNGICSTPNNICSGNGIDQDGLCNIDCNADELCNGKLPLSTLESCGEVGNKAIVDRCSSDCQLEDKPDKICRKVGIEECNGDIECNGKKAGTYNCDEDCMYNEPICSNDICEFSETLENCPEDCESIKVKSCGDNSCDYAESCSDCPEDCGECDDLKSFCGDLICDAGDINYCPEDCEGENDGNKSNNVNIDNEPKNNTLMNNDKAKETSILGKIRCFLRYIFFFEEYDTCLSAS